MGSVDFVFADDAGIDLRKIKVGYSPAWFGSVDFGSTRDATGHDLNGLVPANTGHLAGLEAMRASGVELVEVWLPYLPLASQMIGISTCRERVCQYVSFSMVAGSLRKKCNFQEHRKCA